MCIVFFKLLLYGNATAYAMSVFYLLLDGGDAVLDDRPLEAFPVEHE